MISFQWTQYPDMADPKLVRTQVFHQEQGFSLEGEFDETDKTAHHIVACEDGTPVGTGRLFSENGLVWHIGRVAVLPQCRGQHLGARMMTEMEQKARELGGTSVELSAQVQARGFYATLGYAPRGEEYLDEHCPHIDMVKTL